MARLGPAAPSVEEKAFRAQEGTTAPNLSLAIANAPEVARRQLELLRAATAGMSFRQKELITLLVGQLTGNAYCWGHHVPAVLEAGVTTAQIHSLRAGDYSVFPPEEQVLLAYCAAVVKKEVTDELWEAVSPGRTPEDLMKITMVVAFYCMIDHVQGALDVAQDDGFGGFEVP